MKTLVMSGFLVFLTSASTPADEVRLANGGRLEGIARVEGGKVVVELKQAAVTLDEGRVEKVGPGWCMVHEFRRRLSALGPHPDAEALHAVAMWCRREGLEGKARLLARRVVTLDPGHRGARRMLGHVREGNRWMTPSEARRVRGEVFFRGRWVSTAEKQRTLEVERRNREEILTRFREKKERRLAAVEQANFSFGLPAYRETPSASWGGGGWFNDPGALINIHPGMSIGGFSAFGF